MIPALKMHETLVKKSLQRQFRFNKQVQLEIGFSSKIIYLIYTQNYLFDRCNNSSPDVKG